MVEYRKAQISDIEDLLRIRIDFLIDVKKINSKEEEEKTYKSNKAFLEDYLINGDFVQWIALCENKIVATSSVTFYTLPPTSARPNGKVGYIGNMFTYSEYRNRGIATKLFDLAVKEAKENGCGIVLLDATEMGRPMYEKYGFKKADDAMKFSTI